MKLAMNHTAITVRELERSIEFYRDVMGMELLFTDVDDGTVAKGVNLPEAGMKFANLKSGEGEIELIQFTSQQGEVCRCGPNFTGKLHICFEVDDIEEAYRQMSSKGVEFWTPINVIEEGPAKGWKFVYLSDPDGIQLELLEIPG